MSDVEKLSRILRDTTIPWALEPDSDWAKVRADDMAAAILASTWVTGLKAEAVRDAARAANQGYVDEMAGIGPARVRTDWLFDYADRLELSSDAGGES